MEHKEVYIPNNFWPHLQKFKNIYFQPIVPVATLYLLTDQIAGIGDLEIGGFGEDPGD